ncbi:MAG TPA: agmatine deiminase family protein [Polyangia bacterium]|jgi:agmatine deiminase|nr:agmatine deiminase family protein [Polyangia bacterium]
MKAAIASPSALGFRMPAEWEPHAATWLSWPHERDDWPGKLAPIPWVYGEVVRHLTTGERVRILVKDGATERRARALLGRVGADLGQVDFFRVATDRSWTRDYCPLFVKDGKGEVALTNWKFNGWAKYANHKRDAAVGAWLARRLRRRAWFPTVDGGPRSARVVLEGGSIDVDGRGTLLTTEECLLSPIQARNPGVSREQLEGVLGQYLGVRKVLWLGNGIAGDDTHGHVDDLARFVDARTVVIAQEDDPADANHAALADNRARLAAMTTAGGESLRVIDLPMPAPVRLDGVRLPASYANFYIGNHAVLVPTFNDPNDRRALAILGDLFPTRRVVGIHAVDLVWGLGTLHCMTQQEPA